MSLVTYLFTNPTSVPYGDTAVAVPADGVKFNVEVHSWPFCSDGHSLSVELDVKEGKERNDKVKFKKKSKKVKNARHHHEVEMEAGRIDVPAFAILDGVVTDIETIVKDAGAKRSIEFVFPHFSESLVYDPVVEIHGDDEALAFVTRAEMEYVILKAHTAEAEYEAEAQGTGGGQEDGVNADSARDVSNVGSGGGDVSGGVASLGRVAAALCLVAATVALCGF